MEERINTIIRERIQKNRSTIKDIFNDLVKRWPNCNGFIGFEDMEGMISILFSHNEKFYHMSAYEGFTGYVYQKGGAEIYVPTKHRGKLAKPSKNMESVNFSEMVATIKYMDNDNKIENVGVILIDKFLEPGFDEKDLEALRSIASNISDILNNVDPWNLRSWWQKYESDCIEKYLEILQKELASKLKGREGISLNTQLYKGDKLSIPVEIEVNKTSFSRNAGSTVTEKVLLTGVSHYEPASVTQGMLVFPFPINGPIRGVISVRRLEPLEQEHKEKKEVSEIKRIIKDTIESIDYPLFKKAFDTEDAGVKMFSILNKCNSDDLPIENALGDICRDFGTIDNAKIELFLSPEILSKEQASKYSNLHIREQLKLETEFSKEDNLSFRPRYWDKKDSTHQELRCGIFLGQQLVGGIKSTPLDEKVKSQPHMDGPIIEVFSTFLSKLLSKKEKSRNLNLLFEDFNKEENFIEANFLSRCVNILESNFACVLVFNESNGIASMSFIPHPQNEDMSISQAKMRGIVSKLDLGSQSYINLNNNSDEIRRLGIKDSNGLRNLLNEFQIRSLMIKKIDEKRIILAGTIREKSFKRIFDREDQDNISMLALLYRLKF
ncbi:MAG: hypothetical protein AAF611_11445 [Bacteroidota bacterium]